MRDPQMQRGSRRGAVELLSAPTPFGAYDRQDADGGAQEQRLRGRLGNRGKINVFTPGSIMDEEGIRRQSAEPYVGQGGIIPNPKGVRSKSGS